VDGSSNEKGSGAEVIIENDDRIAIEYSLRFAFRTSNNQAEYEACLAGIRMVKELGASVVTIRSDSQLILSQKKGDYMAKEPILQKYLAKVNESIQGLSGFEIQPIPREQNHQADILSKLASTKNVGNSRSVVEETLQNTCVVLQAEVSDWRTQIQQYISQGQLPMDLDECRKIVKRAAQFRLVHGHLYRRGTSVPLLKCIGPSEVWYVLAEIHEGSCGLHGGGKSLARKTLRAGYY
jgi:ribonuclease HI